MKVRDPESFGTILVRVQFIRENVINFKKWHVTRTLKY